MGESTLQHIFEPFFTASQAGVSGAQGGTRTRTPYGIRPSNVGVYQFRHPGRVVSILNFEYLFSL